MNAFENAAEIECCLRGEKLYGDDFTSEQIEAWLRDEKEAYFQLEERKTASNVYGYHAVNWVHGFSKLPKRSFAHVLGIGSAYGEELRPVMDSAGRITILEPSDGFRRDEISGKPVEYVKPRTDGRLPFPDESFDLITCLSVLHHIPNVSTVVREIYRCLSPGSFALVREPVISMGDWRKPRRGLTSRERGIPLDIFKEIIISSGFIVLRQCKCMFSLTSRLNYILGSPVYNSQLWARLDALLCTIPIWPVRYHPRIFWDKLRPWAVFFVLQKPTQSAVFNTVTSGAN